MTGRQRIVLLLIAAVVLVAGIALASSGGDDDEPGTTAPTTTPAADDGGRTTTDERRRPPQPRVETIRIRDGRPAGGVKTLRYERGDTIRLRFVADTPGEVHIHGFDNEFPVSPSGARLVNFKASLEGIFEIEEHDTGELLARLEIRPR